MTDELRAGLYAFDLVQKRAKRPAGAPDKSLARPVTKVGIVGAGLMASQLALLFARRLGVPVVMTDLDEERVAKGVGCVHGEIAGCSPSAGSAPTRPTVLTGLVTGSTTKDGFADADFVIEAVFEEMAVKQQVFAEVEAVVSPECVLATNTSSLSITEMAAELEHPERVVGFHFFNPVAVMPLLEIIPGEADRRRGPGHGVRHRPHAGQDDDPGQGLGILRRQPAARPLHGRVRRIVDEGTPVATADRAVAGLAPMPPFVLLGLVGPAIALHNSETLHRAFGDRYYVSPSLRAPRRGRQARLLRDGGRPPGARPRGAGAGREARAPGRADRRAGARAHPRRARRGGRADAVRGRRRRRRWTSTWP